MREDQVGARFLGRDRRCWVCCSAPPAHRVSQDGGAHASPSHGMLSLTPYEQVVVLEVSARSTTPSLQTIDGTAIVHLVGAGGHGHPDLAKAGLEVPDCSRSTQAGCVMEMRSFAPGRSLRSTSRPRRHSSREGGPGGSHRGARERLEHTCTGVAANSAPKLVPSPGVSLRLHTPLFGCKEARFRRF